MSARAKVRTVEGSVAERGKAGDKADRWHCDACWQLQDGLCPEGTAVGDRYCEPCQKQWQAGWATSRQQLSAQFETALDSDEEAVGLCRKCKLPLGDIVYNDNDGLATLHPECMAQLKLMEVQVREQARERDAFNEKLAKREEHNIGWTVECIPRNCKLASKLGCKLAGEQGLCCLAMEGNNSVSIVETMEPAASINLEYLALSLQVRLHEGREPLFSLDPMSSSEDPDKAMHVKHFEPEWLMGTSAGEVMFQADYHLKELSMGEYEQPVVGMRSMFDFSEAESCSAGAWRAREWFTVRAARVYRSADGVLIPRVEMGVEAREQVEGPGGSLEDKRHTRPDHPMVRYAQAFSHNFDLIAERRSVVYHLRELAKTAALAKFLLDSQARLDDAWFRAVDWARVKEAAAGCRLEVPQLWHDRHHSKIRLHDGMALGTRDGVSTRTHSVYGGVQFGLDRFSLSATRSVGAHLRVHATTRLPGASLSAMSRSAGVAAQSFGARGAGRHTDPRGVDLNLDRFDLAEAEPLAAERPARPVVGDAFWKRLAGDASPADGHDDDDAGLLKDIFNPHLSDRRGEKSLFVGPETSGEYMQKLRALVEEEASVQRQRREHFFSEGFVVGDPGPLFPASWTATLRIGSAPSQQEPMQAHPIDEVDLDSIKSAAATLVFEMAAEDGTVFRIYRHSGLEVRTAEAHDGRETVGAAFAAGPRKGRPAVQCNNGHGLERYVPRGSNACDGTCGRHGIRAPEVMYRCEACDYDLCQHCYERAEEQRVAEGEQIVNVTQYVTESAPGAEEGAAAGGHEGPRLFYYVVLTTEAGHTIVTEQLPGGAVTWEEDPPGLRDRTLRSSTMSSVDCYKAGLSVRGMRQHSARNSSEREVSASQRQSYAEGVYNRAWAFGAEDWKQVAAAVVSSAPEGARKGQHPESGAGSGPGVARQRRLLKQGRAADRLRSDRDVVLAAVSVDGLGLERAAPPLKNDHGVVSTAVRENGAALRFASELLRSDRGIVLSAVEHDGGALVHASEALRGDRGVAMRAVHSNSFAIELAGGELRADRDLILASVRKNEFAVEHASRELCADREFNLAAAHKNAWALERMEQKWRADRDFMLQVVRRNGFALKFASEALRADKEVVLAALEQDPRAIEHADAERLGLRAGDNAVLKLRRSLLRASHTGSARP